MVFKSEADYEFSSRVFALTKTLQRPEQIQDTLLPAFFLLNRYCQRRPSDASGLHLLALVCERLGHHPHGAALVDRAIAILETAYEETEDPAVETRYVIANATLGRLRLAQGAPAEAEASFEAALGLLADKDPAEGATRALAVQAHLGVGLARFAGGELAEALGALEAAHEVAGADLALRGHVALLRAQVLWALGTDDAREGAKTCLLEWCVACISVRS